MTREQFLEKVKEMLGEDFEKFVMGRAEKALNSGAFDLDDYGNDFILPKIFMSAMGEEIKFQYAPHGKKEIQARNNLTHFL